MVKTIKTTELLYLNEAAKALKNKNFLIDIDCIIGVDNTVLLAYTMLNSSQFSYNPDLRGKMVNARELSAFVKTITLESDFEFQLTNRGDFRISTGTSELFFRRYPYYDHRIIYSNLSTAQTYEKILRGAMIPQYVCLRDEKDVTDELAYLFSLKKDDGVMHYTYNGRFYLTLFNGILPLNKNDRVYLSIFENFNTSNAFNALFRVKKKKFEVIVCIAYLYI